MATVTRMNQEAATGLAQDAASSLRASLFTQVPRRGILRSSPRKFSKACWSSNRGARGSLSHLPAMSLSRVMSPRVSGGSLRV